MDKAKSKAALDQIFRDLAGAMASGMVYAGVQSGLFRAMQGRGPLEAGELARAAGLQPRYVEEWLRGMVAAGYLEYDATAQRYELSEELAYFLASDGTDHFTGGLFAMVPPLLRAAPAVARAFREGGGVAFEDFGPECVSALELVNSGQYEQRLTDYWLGFLPEAVARLRAGGRALDVGCGSGSACIALARAFPAAQIFGIDADESSIGRARAAAQAAGVAERVHLRALRIEELKDDGGFDLILLCDALHDLAAPRESLARLRSLLRPDAPLFIIEPKVADRLEDNRNPVAALFYGFSLFHCMTQSLARGGPGLGTCLGPAATERLVREAGLRRFTPLQIKSVTNLFYAAQA